MLFKKLAVLLLPALAFLNCSGPEQLTVHNEDQPIAVDGILTNWNTDRAILKSSPEIDYYAANDGNNLYLFIDVKGLMKNNAISGSGLIVYLSNSEENRKRSGLGYPPGTYNLLREYPDAFESFTEEMDWSQKPENRELLTTLSENQFSNIMIVERPAGSNDPEFGFINKTRLEVDGFEIAANEDSRLMSIEMKIPLGETSLFNLDKSKDIWLGFSIEPPDFNFRDEASSSMSQTQRDRYGRRSQQTATMQYNLSRNLGGGDDWFIINIDE